MLIATISVDNRNLFRGFGPVLAAACACARISRFWDPTWANMLALHLYELRLRYESLDRLRELVDMIDKIYESDE